MSDVKIVKNNQTFVVNNKIYFIKPSDIFFKLSQTLNRFQNIK